MSDIVERLRNLARNYADGVAGMSPQDHFAWDAADEIERMTMALQEVARLRLETSEGTCAQRFDRAWEATRRALEGK